VVNLCSHSIATIALVGIKAFSFVLYLTDFVVGLCQTSATRRITLGTALLCWYGNGSYLGVTYGLLLYSRANVKESSGARWAGVTC
jgi:hypothetical protein